MNKDLVIHKQVWPGHRDWYIFHNRGISGVRLSYYTDDGSWYISNLYVVGPYRGCGHARDLLDACEEITGHKNIKIKAVSEWLRDWYTRRGYLVVDKDD